MANQKLALGAEQLVEVVVLPAFGRDPMSQLLQLVRPRQGRLVVLPAVFRAQERVASLAEEVSRAPAEGAAAALGDSQRRARVGLHEVGQGSVRKKGAFLEIILEHGAAAQRTAPSEQRLRTRVAEHVVARQRHRIDEQLLADRAFQCPTVCRHCTHCFSPQETTLKNTIFSLFLAGGRRVKARERKRESSGEQEKSKSYKSPGDQKISQEFAFRGHFRREFRRVSSIFSAAGDYSIPPSGTSWGRVEKMNHSWRALLLARSRPVPPRHPVAMWGCTHSSQAGEEPSRDHEVYGLIGEEGFRRLAASFYSRVLLDDVLFPMYASLIFHL